MIALYLDTRDPFQIQMLRKEVNVISAMMLVKRTELSQRSTYQYVWFTSCFVIKKTKTLNIKLIILIYAFLENVFTEKPEKEDCENEEEGKVKRTPKAEKRNEETRSNQNQLWVQKHFDICITQNKLTQNQPCKKELKLNSDFVFFFFLLREKINY